jgi:hypothetical protein
MLAASICGLRRRLFSITVLIAFIAVTLPAFAQGKPSQLVMREIDSKSFADNKIGVSPVRKMAVYLPAGYEGDSARYPVIYLLPSPPASSFRDVFDKQGAQGVFDRAIAAGAVGKFILVSVDMTTPLGSSWYVNSPTTGNWEDFMVQELVPYIDANFRTLLSRDSRGIAGIFMGGYGAIRFGMKYPNVFGSVYAMHPVGTGSGVQIMDARPDWDLLANAKSLDDVRKDGFSQIFTTIFEAHLPNPDKSPLYMDLSAKRVNGELVIDSALMDRLRNNFFIESLIPKYADNLKTLRGFKFDWDRCDGNYDHVYSNQALTHKLNEYGIHHEAEEYNGMWGEPLWGADGRITTEVLPFFQRYLVFEQTTRVQSK